jgi:hypothetical protein
MNQKQFIDLYFAHGNSAIYGDRKIVTLPNLSIRKSFKSLTSLIDYNCQFTNDKCRGDRGDICCCGGCFRITGFLKNISYNDTFTYAELFDEKRGFWRKDGCALPRELRSATCLIYHCGSLISEHERDLMKIINDIDDENNKGIKNYKRKHHIISDEKAVNYLKSKLEVK